MVCYLVKRMITKKQKERISYMLDKHPKIVNYVLYEIIEILIEDIEDLEHRLSNLEQIRGLKG